MSNNNQQLSKEIQYPTSKYDYDGITGTWLLIPVKFHLLMLAISLPIILWVLPNVSFKGDFRFLLADYKYFLAGAVTLFFIASALLSALKAKQVGLRIRPVNRVQQQVIAKIGPGKPAALFPKKKRAAVHVGHVSRNNGVKRRETEKDSNKGADKGTENPQKIDAAEATQAIHAATTKKADLAKTEPAKATITKAAAAKVTRSTPKKGTDAPKTVAKTSAKTTIKSATKKSTNKSSNINKKPAVTAASLEEKIAAKTAPKQRRRKNPDQMHLDL